MRDIVVSSVCRIDLNWDHCTGGRRCGAGLVVLILLVLLGILVVLLSLAGLLIFRQEWMYYLTGYDTAGFVFFQCLFLGADGRLILLTRLPDLMQARRTSVIEDIRIWTLLCLEVWHDQFRGQLAGSPSSSEVSSTVRHG